MATYTKKTLTPLGNCVLTLLILTPFVMTVNALTEEVEKTEILPVVETIDTPKIEKIEHPNLCDLEFYLCTEQSYEVIVTNYGTWDGESGHRTSSGLTTNDFTIEDGFYQYKGYDVLATANTTRWSKSLYDGYTSHELYDILVYELEGEIRQGIVLDVCGACHGLDHEDTQRIDVFTTRDLFGKTNGRVYEKGLTYENSTD